MAHKHYRKENDCLNCGAEVEDKFCTVCGQENLELKEPFWHFIGHSISHYFHFDSKFFNTLIPLLTKPGQVTLDYIAGRRARYLHPVSMYIFVSIVYFLVISLTSKKEITEISPGIKLSKSSEKPLTAEEEKTLKYFPKNLRDTIIGEINKDTKRKLFKKLSFQDQKLYIQNLEKLYKDSSDKSNVGEFKDLHIRREDSTYASYLNRQNRLPEEQQDNFFDRFIKKQSFKFGENYDLAKLADKYKSKLYFLLMPLFAFFVMLNFRKNKRYYVEHLVFTIHFFTAYFIVDTFSILLGVISPKIIDDILKVLIFFAVLWYIYRSLRIFYQRKRWVTIRKIISLSILYLLAFSISATIIGSFIFVTT